MGAIVAFTAQGCCGGGVAVRLYERGERAGLRLCGLQDCGRGFGGESVAVVGAELGVGAGENGGGFLWELDAPFAGED